MRIRNLIAAVTLVAAGAVAADPIASLDFDTRTGLVMVAAYAA